MSPSASTTQGQISWTHLPVHLGAGRPWAWDVLESPAQEPRHFTEIPGTAGAVFSLCSAPRVSVSITEHFELGLLQNVAPNYSSGGKLCIGLSDRSCVSVSMTEHFWTGLVVPNYSSGGKLKFPDLQQISFRLVCMWRWQHSLKFNTLLMIPKN